MERSRSGLHNNHNVYILGAGFSRLRGLPLVSDFMTQMRDALEYHGKLGHDRECKAIESVLSFRLKASSAAYRVQIDLENIEELFSLASASPTQIEENIRLSIAATLDYGIKTKRELIASFKAEPAISYSAPNWRHEAPEAIYSLAEWKAPAYEFIVRMLLGSGQESTENTFITFNYDTLLEDALKGLNVPYHLGFGQKNGKGGSDGIKVMKLHGSVDWAIPQKARTKIEVFDSYRDIVDSGLTPHLIPPTWKKDSRGAFDEIWNQSLRALSVATRVVIIGFSIPPTDQHFKYLLAAGLQNNYSLREIVFMNPGLEQVRGRAKELFANQEHNAAKLRYEGTSLEILAGQGHGPMYLQSVSRPVPMPMQNLIFGF